MTRRMHRIAMKTQQTGRKPPVASMPQLVVKQLEGHLLQPQSYPAGQWQELPDRAASRHRRADHSRSIRGGFSPWVAKDKKGAARGRPSYPFKACCQWGWQTFKDSHTSVSRASLLCSAIR